MKPTQAALFNADEIAAARLVERAPEPDAQAGPPSARWLRWAEEDEERAQEAERTGFLAAAVYWRSVSASDRATGERLLAKEATA